MQRRPLALVLDVLLMLVGALLGIATNYATNVEGEVPLPLRLLRQWSIPLVGIGLLALVGGQLWLRWLERRPVAAPVTWTAGQPPYPGLEAFGEEDAAVFFGRERETAALVARLHPAAPARANRFVTVVGPSGSGKSSLVRAGLLPALTGRRSRWTAYPAITPGTDPVGALRRALDGAVADGRPRVLVVDQLEELLTLSGPRERAAFVAAVRRELARQPGLWLVGTLRSDFLTGFLEAELAFLVRDPVVIGALEREALHEVVARPAAAAGVSFEAGLVSRIVDDCGGGDALPLLAFTLQELYRLAGGPGSVIGYAHYREAGGVAGALVGQADRIRAELLGPDADTGPGPDPVVRTLLRLVTVRGEEPVRRRVPRSELTAPEREIADAFVAGRLLTSDAGVLDLAHEALLRRWPPLRRAVAGHVDELRQRGEWERWAQEWEFAGRGDAFLLTGERLAAARAWQGRAPAGLEVPALVAEYVERSTRADGAARARTADAVAARVLESREPETAVAVALAAVTEWAPTPAALQALRTALDGSLLRAVRGDFGAAVTGTAWSPDGSRLAACAGDGRVRVWRTDGLDGGPDGGRAEPVVLDVPGEWPRTVVWSPDGALLACATRDARLAVWDTATWRRVAGLRLPFPGGGHGEAPGALAFSPDGRRLVSAGAGGELRLWDTASFTPAGALRAPAAGTPWSAAWSPDGGRIAAAGEDGTVRVWPAAGGEPVPCGPAHGDAVTALAWSPDGALLASASADRTVVLREPGTSRVVRALSSMDGIDCLAWSPDGTRLAAGDRHRNVRIWDLRDGAAADGEAAALWLTGHLDAVHAVAWTPDGRRLATASRDRTLAVWEPAAPPSVLRGHTESVWQVAWSPDGGRVASSSEDGTVRLWRAPEFGPPQVLATGQCGDLAWSPDGSLLAVGRHDGVAALWHGDGSPAAELPGGHGAWVSSVCWSPDGTRVATAARDGLVHLRDAAGRGPTRVLRGHGDWVTGTSWSPDGGRLATCGTDRTVIVWDTATGERLRTLEGHEDQVWEVAWSPDGRLLATASRDRTVRLWDPDADGPAAALALLAGHEDRVQDIAWSPDGTRLASVSRDRTLRLWDPAAAAPVAVAGLHADWVNGVAWAPGGGRIATSSRDRTVRLWTPVPRDGAGPLLRLAAGRVLHPPTPEQRRAHQLPPPAPVPRPRG
ncbi:WD40 repeat protein [Streptomyces sp. Ag109_G2-6]|uniref:nSTAND1 domain-containing NTPase n=1 Tax=Streptomyces TaxID=1883 RepID=UPI0009A4AAFE|nr:MULTISPECIES: AAA family ATPase [Streptomyces]RPF29505.1 WD40 repeat protein [Streptomyces sp. Ag109_G2-6]